MFSIFQWLSPAEILDPSCQPDIILYPPQNYELNRLLYWSDLKEVEAFASKQSSLGGHLLHPAPVRATDGLVLALHGKFIFSLRPIFTLYLLQ